MAPKTRKEMREEAAKKRRQQILNLRSKNQKKQQDLKTKKLSRSLYIRDSRGKVKKKKTGLSNIPAAEGMATVNRKARGLSNLPSNYKKEEKKFSDKAKEVSKNEYKKRFPKMGTFKNKDGKSLADEKKKTTTTGSQERYGRAPKGYIKAGTSFVSLKTAKGKQALNKLKAKRRAQEAARKRRENK